MRVPSRLKNSDLGPRLDCAPKQGGLYVSDDHARRIHWRESRLGDAGARDPHRRHRDRDHRGCRLEHPRGCPREHSVPGADESLPSRVLHVLLVRGGKGTDPRKPSTQHPSGEDRRVVPRLLRRVPSFCRVRHLVLGVLHRCDLGGLRCTEAGLARQDRQHLRGQGIATGSRLRLTRAQILTFRRHVGALDQRLPRGRRSLRIAAWAGLQDSMPRAALLSIHARVEGTGPSTWEDPSLVQLWGPRYSAYVIPARDLAVFTLGRLPDEVGPRRVAEDLAARVYGHLRGARMTYGEAGRALGHNPNRLRYAASTGTILIRWDGARQPIIWTVSRPEVDPRDARLELARRYLHVFGPTTAEAFAQWAGIGSKGGVAAFDALRKWLTPVRTPVGDSWILTNDEPMFRAAPAPAASARLLPSGDAYFLLQARDRELLIPDASRRSLLWTSRVWPGGVLVDGEIVGTWRRALGIVTVQSWRRLSRSARDAVEAEAASLP